MNNFITKLATIGLTELNPRPHVLVSHQDGGVFTQRVVLETALRRYERVQLNPDNCYSVLLLDVDSDAWVSEQIRRNARGLPLPNWMVVNRNNDHAHLAFILAKPVHRNAASSQDALEFAHLALSWLNHCYSADPGYTMQITRNPFYQAPHLQTDFLKGRNRGYLLDDLAEEMPTGWQVGKPAHLQQSAIGRNVSLFQSLMHWAGSQHSKNTCVLSAAQKLNESFEKPLPWSEIEATAKSVAKYRSNWNYYDHSSEIQAEKGRKGGLKSGASRRAKNAARNERIFELKKQGKSQREIGRIFGLSPGTVHSVLRHRDKGGQTQGARRSLHR